MGKPSRDFFRLALDDLRATPKDAAMIGDDIDRCAWSPIDGHEGNSSQDREVSRGRGRRLWRKTGSCIGILCGSARAFLIQVCAVAQVDFRFTSDPCILSFSRILVSVALQSA